MRIEILNWNWMYIQALPLAPSIAVELPGEGKGLAVPGGAGNTNQPGQEMVLLCLSTRSATVVNFPHLCTKPPCGFLN